jgi:hypothetical protein
MKSVKAKKNYAVFFAKRIHGDRHAAAQTGVSGRASAGAKTLKT